MKRSVKRILTIPGFVLKKGAVLTAIILLLMLCAVSASAQEMIQFDGVDYEVYESGVWKYILYQNELQIIDYIGEADENSHLDIPAVLDGRPVRGIRIGMNVKSLSIPEGVKVITENAFFGITSLTAVSFPSTLENIERSAFYKCSGLQSVTIPGGNHLDIGELAFGRCTSLMSVRLGDGVRSIGEWAFRNNAALEEIVLPDTLESIGSNAFYSISAPNLKEVDIPDSVQELTLPVVPYETTMIVGESSTALRRILESAEYNGLPYRIRGEEDTPEVNTGETVEERVQAIIEAVITPGMSSYQKAKVLHDYLIQHAQYDESRELPYTDEAAGVLLYGRGVCQSYAEAYALLLNAVHIPNDFEWGDDHIWNMVCLDGSWTHVDCTWDDPISGTGTLEASPRSGREKNLFFCLTNEVMEKIPHHECTEKTHVATDYTMNYAYRHGGLDSLIDELINTAEANVHPDQQEYSFTPVTFGKEYNPDYGQYRVNEILSVQIANDRLRSRISTIEGLDYAIVLSYDNVSGVARAAASRVYQDLSEGKLAYLQEQPFVFTGAPIVPEISVSLGGSILMEGTDYLVTLADNTNAGKASVTVTGMGNYSGELASAFDILAADMENTELTLTEGPYVFSGEEIKPLAEVKMSGKSLAEDVDYTVIYENNLHAGAAKVTVTGNGNMQGTIEREFVIEPVELQDYINNQLTDSHPVYYRIEYNPNSHTRQEIPGSVLFHGSGMELIGVDYDLHYQEDLETGKAVTYITGKNDFTGEMFIDEKDLGLIPLSEVDNRWFNTNSKSIYDGNLSAFIQAQFERIVAHNIEGVQNIYDLQEGKDFTVTVEGDRVNAGEYTITYHGIGRFTGEVIYTHEIKPFNLEEGASLELKQTRLISTGIEKKPDLNVVLPSKIEHRYQLIIDDQGNTAIVYNKYAIPEKEYIAHYSNNISAGTATATVEGIGNFTGTLTAEFQILLGGQDVCRIPVGVTELEQEAFSGTNFSEFILSDAPVTVADRCFSGLQKQTVQITIPHAASLISENAFEGIENLTIIAPESLTITMGSRILSVEDFCKVKGYYYEKLEK